MMEQVRLYEHFKEQIAKMGSIRRAWFTTFNLDIHFFEKYILSAVMNIDHKDLRSPYDYEELNKNLANEEESLKDEEKVEVRVFYDYRALIQSGKQKQTGVHLHPIDIKRLSALGSKTRYRDGVFHPKVTLLETVDNEYWLMVSSANLTFGGWSSNRESFFCEKIVDKEEARDVGLFFDGIISSIRGFNSFGLINKLRSGRFGGTQRKWVFVSSFNSRSFVDELSDENEQVPLRVWSPYFAQDMDELTDELLKEDFADLEVVPAKSTSQKIRITKKTYSECIKKKSLIFLQDRLPDSAAGAFVHAKAWLTPKTLAIGSWNMTRSGMGISKTGNNNVEAGIRYLLTKQEYEQVLKDTPVTPLREPEHFSEQELEQEKSQLLDRFTVILDMVADWDKMILTLAGPTYEKLIEEVGDQGMIRLPGFGRLLVTRLANPIDFRSQSRYFLTDRYIELTDSNAEPLYSGYLREVGLSSRPVTSFDNIDDYLKGWVAERPEEKQELHRLAYRVEEESGDELSDQTRAILQANDQNAWFTSFHAFECILNRIRDSNQYYAAGKRDELKRIGRVLPGNLTELRSHLAELLRLFREERDRFKKSPVYLWFLIEKANGVFTTFNDEIGDDTEHIARIQNMPLEDAIGQDHYEKIGADRIEQWKAYVVRKLKPEASADNA